MAKKQQIQLYRTVTPGAVPSASNLSEGEIAINYHQDNETIFAKNDSAEIKKLSFDDKFIKDNFLNSTGEAENKTMSQKAITQNLEGKQVDTFDLSPYITADSTGNKITISVKELHEHMGNAKVCNVYVDNIRVDGQYKSLPSHGQMIQTIQNMADSGNLITIQFWLTIGFNNGVEQTYYEFNGDIRSLDSEPNYNEQQEVKLNQMPVIKNAEYLQTVHTVELDSFNRFGALPWRSVLINTSTSCSLRFPEYLESDRNRANYSLWPGEHNIILHNTYGGSIAVSLMHDKNRILFIDNIQRITLQPNGYAVIHAIAKLPGEYSNGKMIWYVYSVKSSMQ